MVDLPVSRLVEGALAPVRVAVDRLPMPQPRRKVWRREGRAHIEVRGVHRVAMHGMAVDVERALRSIDGVDWARVNAVLGRVIVSFDDGTVDTHDLVECVGEIETQYGVSADDVSEDASRHPADDEAVRFRAIELGADVAGVALGAGVRMLRLPLLPIEIAAALPAIDMLPPVRRVLEVHRGAEAAFVTTSAFLQGLAQGPAGLLVDASHRVLLLRESLARRQTWERNEQRLMSERRSGIGAIEPGERPVPLPDGLIERYARNVAFGSIGVAGGVLAFTRDPRRTADVLLAGIPRAARLGREAFGAHTGRILAQRDIIVLDVGMMRRLDRVDTVVVDDELLGNDGIGELLDAIRTAAQDFVIAQRGNRAPRDTAADLIVAGGDELVASIRAMQEEGRVVALVSARDNAALAAADLGVGLHHDSALPWAADVLCGTLYDAALVVDATAAARTAGRRVITIAGSGSALATVLAIAPATRSGRRVVLTANATTFAAMAAGIWTSQGLAGRRIAPPGRDPTPWHALDPDDVMRRVASSPAGLASDDAAERSKAEPEEERPAGFGTLVVQELANPLTALLAAGGAVSTVAGSLTDGVLITGVLGANAVIGAVQRLQTDRAIGRLSAALSSTAARVKRDGEPQSIPPTDLVRGDLLVLRAGDIVPADARIVDASGVEADESALTGESVPVAKLVEPVATEVAVADRASMLYAGTAIAAGHADAIVVATGSDTEARRGANGLRPPRTGVEARLDDLTRKVVPATLAAGGILTASSLLRGVPARDAVATGVTLAAAAVPEGLPFLATVAQSAAARRLSQRGVLVRNAGVLEALGRVDVLCFDKTGTLTEGKLAVRSVSDGETTESMPVRDPRLRQILAAAVRATPRRRGERLAHPTDQAIVDAAEAVDVLASLGVAGWRKTTSLPFSSDRGYHAALGQGDTGDVLSVKGAPEVVLPRCVRRRTAKGVVELDERARQKLEKHVARLAGQGLRVLAVAERHAASADLDDDRVVDLDDEGVADLDLLGFVTVADVTRASAAAPIAELQRAGISIVMLTGDHPQTAEAIGNELGLVNGGVVTGPELDAMSDELLDELLTHATVFARVTPAHKVRIVASYRRLGRVVAMTGDGANDAQAIRLADTGIAFGPRATAAARAAADLVIVDDGLETLIAAIVEGRSMWASVRDALALLLGGNLGEAIFTTGAGLVSGRSPLNPRQLLAVNLLTDLAPALAIALQRPPTDRIDLRTEGPESSLGTRLSRDIAVRAAATSAAAGGAWTVARFTGSPQRAGTVALAALVGAQLGQTIVVGYRSPLVLASTALSVGALVTIVQMPGVNRLFGCRPLGPVGWSIAWTSAAIGTGGAMLAARFVNRVDETPANAQPDEIDLRSVDAPERGSIGSAAAS